MNEIQVYYVEYIRQFVKLLTGDKEEFFLSLCDIEEELLRELEIFSTEDYEIVLVNNKDYSQAVRLRNNVDMKRIVLLSGEGIKQIDSLKDFNEYSVLSQNREQIWTCLEQVFHVQFKSNEKTFLEAILEQSELSLWDLLQYLYQAGIANGKINPRALNRNLPMLGIWKSNSTEVLGKGKIRRMMRYSKYGVIENRLTKAIINNKIQSPKKEQIITNALAQGSVQKILDGMYFEEVEKFLKNPPRNAAENALESGGTEENTISEIYDSFSYEFLLREGDTRNVIEIENEWQEERNKEERFIELNWDEYIPLAHGILEHQSEFVSLKEQIGNLNLSREKIDELLKLLDSWWEKFHEVWGEVVDVTPICLYTFCEKAKGYTQEYFQLLSFIMTDEKVRYAMTETGIIPKLQTLLCKVEIKEIKMPFYHPICVFYHMGIREMYKYASQNRKDMDFVKMQIMEALIQKLGMQFPIDFLELDGQQYALDYTTVWKSGKVIFRNVEEGVVYSVLDFRIIYKQVIDYIEKHRFLTEITIALIDISNLGGLIQLADKIRQVSQGEYCNIGRVTFLILSSKEEELQSALSQMWDTIGNNDMVRFRFGRNNYRGEKSNGKVQYDLQKITEEADMTIIADGSVLYHAPRMVRLQNGENMVWNRIEQMDLTRQVEMYYVEGKSDIPVLWDTLQRIARSWEEGLWRWKSKEIDNGVLPLVNQIVSNNENKRIVALSSNEHILSEIFRTEYMQAQRQKYNGKSITIVQFDKENQIRRLPMEGVCEVKYSLNDFYYVTLELDQFAKGIVSDADDISLDISYRNEKFYCYCNVFKEDLEEKDEIWKKRCEDFIRWQMSSFLAEENILSNYLRELLMNQWYEKAQSVPAMLMVEKLCKGCVAVLQCREHDISDMKELNQVKYDRDCMEAVKIHEMISFVNDREVIDEYTVSRFQELFEINMLERVLECNKVRSLLEKQEKTKLLEIQERVKGNKYDRKNNLR